MPTQELLARSRSIPHLANTETTDGTGSTGTAARLAGSLTKPPAAADTYTQFRAAKEAQMAQYRDRAQWHERRRAFEVLGIIAAIILGIAALVPAMTLTNYFLNGGTLYIVPTTILWTLAILLFVAPVPLFQLWRQDTKSATLLSQLGFELNRALAERGNTLEQTKKEVLVVETNFLNNDDELYTKKFLWHPYLNFIQTKQWNKETHPRAFVPEHMPTLWMQENPFELNNDDSDFVYRNWAIKQQVRDLYFTDEFRKLATLSEIEAIADGNPVIVERMLRQKKISKGLKAFKRQARIRYLSPGAKMRLVSFVDSVLAQRDYVDQCDAMQDLLRSKDVQIMKYTDEFWRVHRRSLKFYGFELLGALLVLPLLIISFLAWALYGGFAAAGTFVLGGAILSFGQMALVTTQLRDMKAKKLTPSLVSSLIAIRHNICADTVLDDEQVYQYERTFKAAEKRFMLTATEIEPVKIAKENVSDKVTARLQAQMIALRANKEAQGQVYYEKFNYYRRKCIKFSAIETFVALLMIPAAVSLLFDPTGVIISSVIIGIGIVIEILAFRRHLIFARRKELYLLIYQKMAVLLSDYRLFQHPDYIAAELEKLEDSIRRAAALDDIIDVDEQIGDISTVDLGTFDDTMWERMEVLQDTPTAQVVKPEVALADLIELAPAAAHPPVALISRKELRESADGNSDAQANTSQNTETKKADTFAMGAEWASANVIPRNHKTPWVERNQGISPARGAGDEQPEWLRIRNQVCCENAKIGCNTSPCESCCVRCKVPTCAEHRSWYSIYQHGSDRLIRYGALCQNCEPCDVSHWTRGGRTPRAERTLSCNNCRISICRSHNFSPSKFRADALCQACAKWSRETGWDPNRRNRVVRAIWITISGIVAAFILITVLTEVSRPATGARARHNAIGTVATAESIVGVWRGNVNAGWRFYGDGTGQRIWNDDLEDFFTWQLDDYGNLVIPATDIFRERTYTVRTDGGVLSLLSSRELSTGEVIFSDWNYRRVIESDQVLAADRSNLAEMLVGYWRVPNVTTINRGWMFFADGTGIQYEGSTFAGAGEMQWEIAPNGRLFVTTISGGHERQREYTVTIVDNTLILNSVVGGSVSTHGWEFVRTVPWL